MDLRPNPSSEYIAKQDESAGVSSADWADRTAGSARALLAEFSRTGDERVFEEVVRRYAGMVHAVCVRVLKDAHEAEDATQAVFLALAMHVKTRPDKPIQYIGPWLQQVAKRLALDMRRSKTRRNTRQAKLGALELQRLGIGYLSDERTGGVRRATLTDAHAAPLDQLDQEELRHLIAAELEKLPAKYRLPLILHYFGGMSREEMSKELGIKPNTLGVRVFRGRELLAKRLADKGIALSGAVLVVVLEEVVRASVSDAWISATAHAAGTLASAGPSAVTGVQVASLLRAVSRGMMLSKLKIFGIAVLLLATVSAGGAELVTHVAEKLNLKPNLNWNVSRQIRELLRSLVQPTLSVDVTAVDAELNKAIAQHRSVAWPAAAVFIPSVVVHSAEHSLVASHAYGGMAPLPDSPGAAAFAVDLKPRRELPEIKANQVKGSTSASPVGHHAFRDRSNGHTALPPPAHFPSPPSAVIAGARNSNETHVLGADQQLYSGVMVVGAYGSGTFEHSGTNSFHRVDRDLTLGLHPGSRGRYELSGPGTRLNVGGNEIVGAEGFGEFIQSDGANIIGGTLIVGQRGHGRYENSGGQASAEGGMVVGEHPGSLGEVQLLGGDLVADPQLIGKGGDGRLSQVGGRNTARTVWVAPEHGSTGTYSLPRGILELDALANVTDADVFRETGHAGINVGGAGSGSFRMGKLNQKAKIVETHAGSYLSVRAKEAGSGTFRGWGDVDITGKIINNGQIIADGYGRVHALDLSTASGVVNTIENLPIGGQNGWFARNGGELLLPPVRVVPGSGHYSWGESADDALPDLINSVRLHVDAAQAEGDIRVSLLALDRTGLDIPAFPDGHHLIGVWSYDSDVVTAGIDLAVRYDDLLAESMGLDEDVLKLWRFDPGDQAWERINDASFRRYPALNIVSGHTGENFTFFAVSAPEPLFLTPVVLGGWLLLRRRRYKQI